MKIMYNQTLTTVNGKRFTGLNFYGFHGFQGHREGFFVNISTTLSNRHFWLRKRESMYFRENFSGVENAII